jgi:hypothetical protein
MGGGYISCGKFLGDDKSGSALQGVLRAIVLRLPPECVADFDKDVASPLLSSLDQGMAEFEISPRMVARLVGPLTDYHAYLDEILGHPDPEEAPELDRMQGLDMTKAKYGAGLGWQFTCTYDLLRACEVSKKEGLPILINFD